MADSTEDFKKWLETLEDLKNNPKKKQPAPAAKAEETRAKKPAPKRKPIKINLARIFKNVVVGGLLAGGVYGFGAGFSAPHHDEVGTVTKVDIETTDCGCGDANNDGKSATYTVKVGDFSTTLSESDVNNDNLAVGDKVKLNVHEAGGFFGKHIDGYKGKIASPKH